MNDTIPHNKNCNNNIKNNENENDLDDSKTCSLIHGNGSTEITTVNFSSSESKGLKFPLRTLSSISVCGICLSYVDVRSFSDSCLHTFCEDCHLNWLKIKLECPICRSPVGMCITFPSPSHHVWSADLGPRSSWQLQTYLFRKKVYVKNVWINIQDLANISKNYRKFTPQFYRMEKQSQVYRIVPWLNREVFVLLHNLGFHDDSYQCLHYVVDLILSILPHYSIQSQKFKESVEEFFLADTNHFTHEFYAFACSLINIFDFDEYAVYYRDLNSCKSEHTVEVKKSTMTLYSQVQKFFIKEKPLLASFN